MTDAEIEAAYRDGTVLVCNGHSKSYLVRVTEIYASGWPPAWCRTATIATGRTWVVSKRKLRLPTPEELLTL